MISRRDLIKLTAQAGALAMVPGLSGCKKREKAPAVAASTTPRPRYFVQLLLSGGHDPVYTTDPKDRSEVDANVDLPEHNDIASVGELRLGASFAPLADMADKLCALNGVQVGTANHDTGLSQFLRLKTNPVSQMPGALDIIGAVRDDQPLGVAYLNLAQRVLHSPGFFGTGDSFYLGPDDIFDRAEKASPDELAILADVLLAKADGLRGAARTSSRAAASEANLREVAAYFDRVKDVEPLTIERRSTDYVEQAMSKNFDRALWLLENDLSRCVFIDLGLLGWDTHIANADRQLYMNRAFVTHFHRFMTTLAQRENGHGKLAANTVVIGGSDLGRFPRLNDMEGKDHLPQTSYFFSGPGLASGRSFGGTDATMAGLPVSIATGTTAKGVHRPVLDDIGSTMLTLAGLAPEEYGYTGRVLDFLLDAPA